MSLTAIAVQCTVKGHRTLLLVITEPQIRNHSRCFLWSYETRVDVAACYITFASI